MLTAVELLAQGPTLSVPVTVTWSSRTGNPPDPMHARGDMSMHNPPFYMNDLKIGAIAGAVHHYAYHAHGQPTDSVPTLYPQTRLLHHVAWSSLAAVCALW